MTPPPSRAPASRTRCRAGSRATRPAGSSSCAPALRTGRTTMRKSIELLSGAVVALAALGFSAGATAQAAQQGQNPAAQPAPAKSLDDLPPGSAPGGIQGQNIFEVKPEVKPDASSQPDYLKQNNAQRNQVQPGNNAPMWRGVV